MENKLKYIRLGIISVAVFIIFLKLAGIMSALYAIFFPHFALKAPHLTIIQYLCRLYKEIPVVFIYITAGCTMDAALIIILLGVIRLKEQARKILISYAFIMIVINFLIYVASIVVNQELPIPFRALILSLFFIYLFTRSDIKGQFKQS